ncbi:hypothetical protein B5F07_06350 [Lachnoclostridium sp. An169]|uniref:AAA family ATPase n=1 Tax=Lachnoclostridium sp. An169 TaxID=1965569 RepID=UPI000B39FBCA|nr:AAA family ATPase [Lachnoclostridium sp. An169]OUP84871.1 hypothetical protein B5F07_06350 [Lachnoclostridium sp. An169]HJA65259.1 ATP-binding cassette domain-containing protein [Candidatus Mediterraneibacter cottocaccae]
MVFYESFRLDFCDGINVLIGENGVGKTTVLKMLYAASQWSNETVDRTRKKRLLQLLLALQKNGMQIFIATHIYNFAKYLEIRRTDKEQVMFHNLYKKYEDENMSSSLDYSGQDDAIYSQSAYRMEEIEKNHIMIADNRLLDEVYDM